jgi:predicted metal-dependent hydrolase
MPDSQTIKIEGIGNILFEHSRRTRRILITIRPHHGVRVAIPYHTPLESALKFVQLKKKWINKHLAKLKDYEKIRRDFDQAFQAIDKTIATKQITARLRYLAKKHGFKYEKVTVRNQRTRWGSCSTKGNISLNIKLIALPAELADYILLHELVHTRVHNHSSKFWKELDKYVGNGKALAARMTEYGVRLL